MVNHLYIIGNGFDKHHDIPSGYLDYRNWLEKNECLDIIETIDNTFGYTDDDWWRHFEENLASAETLRIATEEAFQNYPNFGSDDFRDRDWYVAELSVERKMEKAYNDIMESFHKWVMQLPNGNVDKKIRIHKDDAIFMSFNYTNTLEYLYGIPPERILYIHGKAGSDEELILGHGLTSAEIEKRMGERIDEGDYVNQRAKDAAVSCVSDHKKDVKNIIEKNNKWFSSLSSIKDIHIYGHSLGDVDLPYYRKIFKCVNNRNNLHLEISDYENKNTDVICQFMKKSHFGKDQYSIVELSELVV